MSVSTPFIRRPIATSLLMLALFMTGLAAYPFLPVAALPQIDFPTIQVTVSLPGASPETMAATVAQPLERQFAQIAGVTQITSTSVLGSSAVTVQFDLNRSIDGAAQDIQAAINAASGQLPARPAEPAHLSQGEPRGFAHPDPGGDIGRAAADRRRRQRRHRARAADQPDRRRGAGDDRRRSRSLPCGSRSTRPGSPRSDCRSKTCAA